MKKRVIYVLCAVLILALTCTSVFAGTSSFGKGYGFEYGIDKISTEHRSTMGAAFPDLVGTEIDGSVAEASDYVILNTVTDDEMNKYTGYGNGLRNVYVWKQNTDGSVSKLYGGTGTYAGYEGYAIHRDGVTYALGDGVKTTPKIYSTNTKVAGSTTGGTWVIKPGTTNCKVTLGKYDVNMNGISEFTVKLSRWSADWNDTPDFSCIWFREKMPVKRMRRASTALNSLNCCIPKEAVSFICPTPVHRQQSLPLRIFVRQINI